MTRQMGILVVDDEARWRSQLADVLAKAGFRVETASTYQEALDKLTKDYFHIIVLDIRLADHSEANVEGMMLLRDLQDLNVLDASEMIMLSAYGTSEQMRQAFRQYRVADFLDKNDFRGRNFIATINQIIIERVRCNFALAIEWQSPHSCERATAELEVGGLPTRGSADFHARVASELDNLLCRLFHESEKIVVRQIECNRHFGTLWVESIDGGQISNPVIVTFGGIGEIARHYENYKLHIEPLQQPGPGLAKIGEFRRTALLGGLIHVLPYASMQNVRTFNMFYRETEISQIRSVLDNLHDYLWKTHYQHRSPIETRDLSLYYLEHFDLSIESIEVATAELLPIADLSSTDVEMRLSDNVGLRVELAMMDRQNHHRPAAFSTIHGDLRPDNILIDDAGNAHIVDYGSLANGHIFCDFVSLDSAVRLLLLESDELIASEFTAMERSLSLIHRFEDLEGAAMLFHADNPDVNKALDTAIHLRTLARKLALQNPTSDISEYYIASLYHALHVAQQHDLPLLKRRLALCSAVFYFDAIDQVYQASVDHLESEITRLSQLNQSKFEYLRNASHELRRPLGNIKAVLEDYIAGDYGLISDSQRKKLESALESLNDEFKLINRMFDLTAMEAGIVRMSRVPTNALDCVRAAIYDNRSFLNTKGLNLAEYLPDQGIEIVGDHLFLRQALSNLLHNAIKFTEHGTITVSCRQDDSWVRIIIKDTGIGIPHELKERIWQPYYQVDRSLARQYQGLGAGLYLAKAWIEQNDGVIHVESRVGEGSTFAVSLPLRSIDM